MTADGHHVRRIHAAAVAALLVALAAPTQAAEVHVDAINGSDASGDGTAASPYQTITHAKRQAPDGDDLIIAAGTYDTALGESFPIVPGCISLRGVEGAEPTIASGDASAFAPLYDTCPGNYTIAHLRLVGASDQAGVEFRHPVGGWPVIGVVDLVGLTIEGYGDGIAVESYAFDGAKGVLELGIRRCEIRVSGTGIRATAVALADDETPTWATVEIRAANTIVSGGDLGVTADSRSDGVLASGTVGLTFDNGAVLDHAGDAIAWLGDSLTVTNSILAFNGGFGVNASIWEYYSHANLFWQNASGPSSSYATVEELNQSDNGEDNIAGDPLFVDRASGDLHLQAGSPCIDAGRTNDLISDVAGLPRPVDGDLDGLARPDIGAHEVQASGALRRADLASADPPSPALRDIYPFGAGNPLTPVVADPVTSGDLDPTPGILSDSNVPLALYQLDPGGRLMLVADRAQDSVRIELR